MQQASTLHNALRVNEATVTVVFTGCGGKTTCSEAMAAEALALGRRVILTTTTKIRVPSQHVDASSTADVARALRTAREVLVLGRVAPDGKKLQGPPLTLLEALREEAVANLIVIEADGSRGASVKGYRDGEPVLPRHVDRACVVLGIDAIGADRQSPLVHRPEILWPLLGLRDDARLTVEDVARAVLDQHAFLGHASEIATAILINKIDDPRALELADMLVKILAPHLVERGVTAVFLRGRALAESVVAVWGGFD